VQLYPLVRLEKLGLQDSSSPLAGASRGIGAEICPSLLGLGGGLCDFSVPGVPILPGFEKIFIFPSFLDGIAGALVDGDGKLRSVDGSGGGCGIAWGMFTAAVARKTAFAAAPAAEGMTEPARGGVAGDGSVADRFRIEDCIAYAAATWDGCCCCEDGGAEGCASVGSKYPGACCRCCCCWAMAARGEVCMAPGGAVAAEDLDGGRGVVGGTSLMVEVEELEKVVNVCRAFDCAEDVEDVDELDSERPWEDVAPARIGGGGWGRRDCILQPRPRRSACGRVPMGVRRLFVRWVRAGAVLFLEAGGWLVDEVN